MHPLRPFGHTGVSLHPVGLGTWAFGSGVYGAVPEPDAVDIIAAALDRGVTFFDTAPLYGNPQQDGVAEIVLGRGLGAQRDAVLISTKFGRNPSDGSGPNFHARRARESVEASLQRLETDRIDLLFFHSPFSESEIDDDVWEALDALKAAGKIRWVGHSISMFERTSAMALRWAQERRIDAVQTVYSLLNRESAALIDALAAQGTAVVARESLANGFLSGTVTPDTVFPEGHINRRYTHAQLVERCDAVDALRFLVRGPVRTLPQAAYRWVLDNPGVSLVLAGARSPAELDDALAAVDTPSFSPEEIAQAERVHTFDFPAA